MELYKLHPNSLVQTVPGDVIQHLCINGYALSLRSDIQEVVHVVAADIKDERKRADFLMLCDARQIESIRQSNREFEKQPVIDEQQHRKALVDSWNGDPHDPRPTRMREVMPFER
jgi:hypothetical protein